MTDDERAALASVLADQAEAAGVVRDVWREFMRRCTHDLINVEVDRHVWGTTQTLITRCKKCGTPIQVESYAAPMTPTVESFTLTSEEDG